MANVVLDYAKFRLLVYPFSDPVKYPDALLDTYFELAETLINNTDCSIITSLTKREKLLYFTMAHLMTLLISNDGTHVGRVSSATQGSVSVALEYKSTMNAAWWVQTQWGAMVWQLTTDLRSFVSITCGD